jgi:hypothetical protein
VKRDPAARQAQSICRVTLVWSSIAVRGYPGGTALAAVLLIASWFLPESPASFPERPKIVEKAVIRIRSARKWPEKIALDTNQPTMPSQPVEAAPTEKLVERLFDEVTDQTSVDFLPKRKPDARTIDAPHPFAQAKRGTATAF